MILGLFLALAFATVSAAQTAGPSATLTWAAPTTYVDGTAIPSTVTITYNVYQGPSASALVKVASGVTALTDTVTTGLSDGQTYYWAVTAVANSIESAQSNVGSKTFASVATGAVTLTVK